MFQPTQNKQFAYELILQNLSMQFAVTIIRELESNISNLSPELSFTYKTKKVFKAETGKTPFEFLMDIKIQKPMELFKSKQYSF